MRHLLESSITIADLEDLQRCVSSLAIDDDQRRDEPVARLLQQNIPVDVLRSVDISRARVPGFHDDIALFPHQIVAREWMEQRESVPNSGGILADDMGLGKTVEMLARVVDGRPLKAEKGQGWAASTLIVCPVSLLSQWVSEVKRIVPKFVVIEHHGTDRALDAESLQRAHVVVSSYSVVMSEWGNFHFKRPTRSPGLALHHALFDVNWWRIVLDEAHTIKNRDSKTSQACCSLRGKYRWCLTGTPMQNRVSELYPFFKFLRLKPFDDWDIFEEDIIVPMRNGDSQLTLARLQAVLPNVMLRRRKDERINGQPILLLPKRQVQVVACIFSPAERAFYDALEMALVNQVDDLVREHIARKNYSSVLEMLTRLRQACNHPMLVHKASKIRDGMDLDGLVAKVIKSFNTASQCTNSGLPPPSAKINKTIELIKEAMSREEKTIVFSQFTSMLDLLEPFLKFNRIAFVRYDGSMTKERREKALADLRLSAQIRCILISFKAGNTGLNLTACNNVILVDLWWNPALEDQAFDRAHRVGQTKDVRIYKLTVANTVEERILQLQDRKRVLARAAIDGGDNMDDGGPVLEELIDLFHTKASCTSL